MILNHLWGLYSRPQEQWRDLGASREALVYSICHILVIALVPVICSYFSAVYLGWHLSLEATSRVAPLHALLACAVLYLLLILGVLLLSWLAYSAAKLFAASTAFVHALELSAYVATPLFMSGFCALYPKPWFIALIGCAGLCYSLYLLFTGVKILIPLPQEKRLQYTLTVVGAGLVLLLSLLGIMIWVWQ